MERSTAIPPNLSHLPVPSRGPPSSWLRPARDFEWHSATFKVFPTMTVKILLDDKTEIPPPWLIRRQGVSEAEFMGMADEDCRWELIDGEMIMHSPATPDHDNLVVFISSLARFHADE